MARILNKKRSSVDSQSRSSQKTNEQLGIGLDDHIQTEVIQEAYADSKEKLLDWRQVRRNGIKNNSTDSKQFRRNLNN